MNNTKHSYFQAIDFDEIARANLVKKFSKYWIYILIGGCLASLNNYRRAVYASYAFF
jgi:hypothetical protein